MALLTKVLGQELQVLHRIIGSVHVEILVVLESVHHLPSYTPGVIIERSFRMLVQFQMTGKPLIHPEKIMVYLNLKMVR